MENNFTFLSFEDQIKKVIKIEMIESFKMRTWVLSNAFDITKCIIINFPSSSLTN